MCRAQFSGPNFRRLPPVDCASAACFCCRFCATRSMSFGCERFTNDAIGRGIRATRRVSPPSDPVFFCVARSMSFGWGRLTRTFRFTFCCAARSVSSRSERLLVGTGAVGLCLRAHCSFPSALGSCCATRAASSARGRSRVEEDEAGLCLWIDVASTSSGRASPSTAWSMPFG